jgi:hypothetical protein
VKSTEKKALGFWIVKEVKITLLIGNMMIKYKQNAIKKYISLAGNIFDQKAKKLGICGPDVAHGPYLAPSSL